MSFEPGKRTAAVWLPLPDVNMLGDKTLLQWLYRGDLTYARTRPVEPLDALAELSGATAPSEGRASLRFFGQTGDSPSVWMAGADPVYLEPRLDHLFVHAFAPGEISVPEFRALFHHLQDTLATAGEFAFARVAAYGYLRSDAPLSTAGLSAQVIDQRVPNDYLPAGVDAADFRSRLSEIEMALHEHEVNQARQARGEFPINSLWIWGGGRLPDIEPRPLPPLFCNDPLLIGYWRLCGGSLTPLPVSVPEIIDITDSGFATVLPRYPETAPLIEPALAALRKALHTGRLDEVCLHFANDLKVTLQPRHRFRYWRRASPVPELERQPA
jgi:hypothetical protein